MPFLPEVEHFFSKKTGQKKKKKQEHSRDKRPGSLRAIVARVLSRANLESSVSCQQDELGAKGGWQGHSKALPSALPTLSLSPLLCCCVYFSSFKQDGLKGKPQAKRNHSLCLPEWKGNLPKPLVRQGEPSVFQPELSSTGLWKIRFSIPQQSR